MNLFQSLYNGLLKPLESLRYPTQEEPMGTPIENPIIEEKSLPQSGSQDAYAAWTRLPPVPLWTPSAGLAGQGSWLQGSGGGLSGSISIQNTAEWLNPQQQQQQLSGMYNPTEQQIFFLHTTMQVFHNIRPAQSAVITHIALEPTIDPDLVMDEGL